MDIRLLVKEDGEREWSVLNEWPQANAAIRAADTEHQAARLRKHLIQKARLAKDGWYRHYYRYRGDVSLRLEGC